MVVAPDLVLSIRTKLEAGWSQIGDRINTAYYAGLTNAIGVGISLSINNAGFTTVDVGKGGSPAIAGSGTGVGIRPDVEVLSREIYTRIRSKAKAFAQTLNTDTGHPPWPAPSSNALYIFAKSISDAVFEKFSTQILLTSTHPTVYLGIGEVDTYTNIDSSIISSNIFTNSNLLQGPMWPQICDAIGEALDFTLQNHTEAQVNITGTCSPSINQVCGLDTTGEGIGTIG